MSYIEVNGNVDEKYIEIAKSVAEQVIRFMNQPEDLEVAIEFVSEGSVTV